MEITYEEFIQNILETRGRFACGDEYHERHHIVARCMGGTDEDDNLIDLLAREHFEAHRLLALENPNNIKLVYAWNRMCNSKNGDYKITPEEYEELRIAFAQTPFTEETRQKMSESQKARWTEELREEWGNKYSGKNNPNFGNHMSEENKQKIGDLHRGVSPSEETRKKLSESQKAWWTDDRKEELSQKISGENHPMFGRNHSEESKKKNSESHKGKKATEEAKQNMSKSQKERWTDELKEQWSQIQKDNWTEERKQKQSERMSGENNPMFGVHGYGQDHPMFGKHMTEESKRKSSESHKGLQARGKHPRAKKVIRLFDLKIYDCGKDAAIDNDIDYSIFKNKCQKHKDFMYYDEWLMEQNNLEKIKK